MNYRVLEIPIKQAQRPGIKTKKEFVVLHSTANSAPAINERNNLARPDNKRIASFHYVVDDVEAIRIIPENELAYHGGNKEANHKGIGIEICEVKNQAEAINNGAKLTASVLRANGWGVDRIRKHNDFLQSYKGKKYYKVCPRIMSKDNWKMWGEFKMLVQKYLDELNSKEVKRDEDDLKSWAEEAHEYYTNQGVTDGKKPNKLITKQEVLTILYRLGVK